MTTQIRNSVFETNSSSSHSISVTRCTKLNIPKLAGDYEANFGEFGWGYDELTHWMEKLSYVMTSIKYFDKVTRDSFTQSKWFLWLNEMFQEFTGYNIIPTFGGRYYEMGYIDHQSIDLLEEYFVDDKIMFKSMIKDLIFSSKYEIIIDNDNR